MGNANFAPGSPLFGPTFFKICPNARNSLSQSLADHDRTPFTVADTKLPRMPSVTSMDAFANLLGRAAEVDAGIATPLVWTSLMFLVVAAMKLLALTKKVK